MQFGSHHTSETRARIRISQILNRLQACALGKLRVPMNSTQVEAALVLLNKTLPDLKSVRYSGEVGESRRVVVIYNHT